MSIVVAAGIILAIWFLARVLEDPFKGFLILLPLTALTRSLVLPIVGERITAFDVLLLVWWAGVALRKIRGHSDLRISRALVLPAIVYYGYLIATVASLFNASSLLMGLEEIAVYLLLGLWGFTVFAIASSEERIQAVCRVLIWTVLGVSLIAIWEALAISSHLPMLLPVRREGLRLTGTFRNPNQLAGYVRTMIPLVWSSLLFEQSGRRFKLILALATGTTVITLVLTSSRASLIATAVELVLLGLLTAYVSAKRHRPQSMRWALIGTGLTALLIPALPVVAPVHWETFAWRAWPVMKALALKPQIKSIDPYLSTTQAEFAANNWTLAWTAFSENPVWGTGIGNFGQSYHILSGIEGTEVHSQYGAVLAETGILGAIPFLVFLIIILRRTAKLLSAKPVLLWIAVALAISLLGNLVAGIYVIFFRRREVWLVFSLLLAYADLLGRSTDAAGESGTAGSGLQPRRQGQRS